MPTLPPLTHPFTEEAQLHNLHIWRDLLASGTIRKIRGKYQSESGKSYCAIGVAHLLIYNHEWANPSHPIYSPRTLRATFGIDADDYSMITALNDNPLNRGFTAVIDYLDHLIARREQKT